MDIDYISYTKVWTGTVQDAFKVWALWSSKVPENKLVPQQDKGEVSIWAFNGYIDWDAYADSGEFLPRRRRHRQEPEAKESLIASLVEADEAN